MNIGDECSQYRITDNDQQLLEKSRVQIVIETIETMKENDCISVSMLARRLTDNMPHRVSIRGWYETIRDIFKQKQYKERTRGFRRIKSPHGDLLIHRLPLATKQQETHYEQLSKVA